MTSPVPDLELDPVAAQVKKRQREHRLWKIEVPLLRLFGFLFITALIAIGEGVLGAPSGHALALFAVLSVAWAGLSSALLWAIRPGPGATRAGLTCLALDFIPIMAILWMTGAEASLFFFLPMAHVANQASRGSGHVFVYGNIGTAFYLAMLWMRTTLGHPVDWQTGLLKAALIWSVCFYVAVSARSADALRRRLAALFRVAREVVRELNEKTRALEESREALHAQATRDTVTGLWNRSAILDVVERGLRRAQHGSGSFAVVLADLDWFKDINDAYGHQAGDRALYETGRRLQALLRPHDAVGRWGGEEFLVALPDCGRDEAAALAERLRAGLEAEEIRPAEAPPVSITSSFGVAAVEPGEDLSAEALVRAADHALYRAKRRGRNRVEVADPLTAEMVEPPPLPVP
jgi:diguanylate cyclase (GGDEF)-like protein